MSEEFCLFLPGWFEKSGEQGKTGSQRRENGALGPSAACDLPRLRLISLRLNSAPMVSEQKSFLPVGIGCLDELRTIVFQLLLTFPDQLSQTKNSSIRPARFCHKIFSLSGRQMSAPVAAK